MYTAKVLILRWHPNGITWAPKIRMRGFDLVGIHPKETEYREAFAGKISNVCTRLSLDTSSTALIARILLDNASF